MYVNMYMYRPLILRDFAFTEHQFFEKIAILTNLSATLKKWEDKFPNDFVDWSNKFLHIYRSSKDNKLRQFSFKLLHRTIVTKKELNKFRLVNDAACTFCSNPDSIEHTFLDMECCNILLFRSILLV